MKKEIIISGFGGQGGLAIGKNLAEAGMAEGLNVTWAPSCLLYTSMLVAQAKAAEERFFETAIPDRENERILRQLRREMGNIVLIGMPGCGKSTIGQLLSEKTGREAVDIDQRIAQRAGCSIPEIFARGGEAEFRALEREETAKMCIRDRCYALSI